MLPRKMEQRMNKDREGVLTIISGFSGSGKGTVVKELLGKHPDRLRLSVSATTRLPRPGDVEGVDYFFLTREKFEDMIRSDMLLEHASYVGNYYGTPRAYVEECLDQGYDVILEIEQQGAFQVKKAMPGALLVFLAPPSAQELEQRLRRRDTETEQQISDRLCAAAGEAAQISRYDYFVVNDDVSICADEIYKIIEAEHCRTAFNIQKMTQLQNDLQKYRKEDQ